MVMPVVEVPVPMIMRPPAIDAVFAINPVRREVAGAGIGGALFDVVVLRQGGGRCRAILHIRVGQPLIGSIGLKVSRRARADIAARRAAVTASAGRRDT